MAEEGWDEEPLRAHWVTSEAPVGDAMCKLWYDAEWSFAPPRPWHTLPRAAVDEIRRRVTDVFVGRVSDAEHTQGDAAVLVRGATRRMTSCQEFLPYVPQRHDAGPVADTIGRRGWPTRRWSHWFDSMDLIACMDEPGSLFGNTNIGKEGRCNLVIAHQLASDQHFHLRSWWLTTPTWPQELCGVLERGLRIQPLTAMMGDAPVMQFSMMDLLTEQRPLFAICPVRQTFAVRVGGRSSGLMSGLVNAAQQLRHAGLSEWLVYVHVEGWQVRDVA